MSSDVNLPVPASRRIRAFAVWQWVFGAVVMMIMAAVMIPRIGVDPWTGEWFVARSGALDPWESRGVPDADHVAGTEQWSANGSARVPLSAEVLAEAQLGDGPLVLTVETESYIRVYAADRFHDRSELPLTEYRDSPDYLDSLWPDDELIVVPPEEGIELWVETDDPWVMQIAVADVQPLVGSASGAGSAYLLYEGDALSATFTHIGESLIEVRVVQGGDARSPIIESGPYEGRFSWSPAPWTIVQVLPSGRGESRWQIVVDEPQPAPGLSPPATTSPALPDEDPADTPDEGTP